jgi:hypothetical protein
MFCHTFINISKGVKVSIEILELKENVVKSPRKKIICALSGLFAIAVIGLSAFAYTTNSEAFGERDLEISAGGGEGGDGGSRGSASGGSGGSADEGGAESGSGGSLDVDDLETAAKKERIAKEIARIEYLEKRNKARMYPLKGGENSNKKTVTKDKGGDDSLSKKATPNGQYDYINGAQNGYQNPFGQGSSEGFQSGTGESILPVVPSSGSADEGGGNWAGGGAESGAGGAGSAGTAGGAGGGNSGSAGTAGSAAQGSSGSANTPSNKQNDDSEITTIP